MTFFSVYADLLHNLTILTVLKFTSLLFCNLLIIYYTSDLTFGVFKHKVYDKRP